MKIFMKIMFFAATAMFYLNTRAYANIAPLKINQDKVEPLENPMVSIQSADITVTPNDEGFKFDCTYVLKGLDDVDSLTIGVPGDLGYTMEAGYIDNINIYVNTSPASCTIYNTTDNLSDVWKQYNSPLHFKWHTFTIPVRKDEITNIHIKYNMMWRVVNQTKDSPYHIVPFMLSTDKLFGSLGNYKIKYINDDYMSPPDVKVMINSMLEPNIISPAILSPKWDDTQILWEFKDISEFQDFRLIVLSYKKLAMEFSTGTDIDHSIRWAVLNSNYNWLASTFEDIAKKRIRADLDSDSLITASYLSSEFYYRIKNYDKALDMLSSYYKTTLWPAAIKYEFITSIKLKEQGDYHLLIDELEKLSRYKDYILITSYSSSEIAPAAAMLAQQAAEEVSAEYSKAPKQKINSLYYILIAGLPILSVSLFIAYRKIKD